MCVLTTSEMPPRTGRQPKFTEEPALKTVIGIFSRLQ